MKRILLVLMSVFMLAFLVGCGNDASKPAETGKPSTSEKITVQAAASLKGALTELADAYKKSHNLADDQIAINFAGSGHCVNKLNKVHQLAYSSLLTKKI